MNSPSLQQCGAMLSHIPATDREIWVRIGMALHSEYPSDDGFDAFDTWSKSAANYDAMHARSVWRGFKPGAVKIGTLIDEAKRRGFVFDRNAEPASALTPEQIASARAEREERERKAQADTETAHKAARAEAERRFAAASDAGTSEYLSRKRCAAHGLKYERGGVLLVPMRDADGLLWNLQTIAVNGEKRFLKGGRKSGLFHWVGHAPETELETVTERATILIAEGYATAASLHEACGSPCVVAFDAGNLVHVAKAIRGKHPKATIVLCADDDANARNEDGTPKHADGNNPGVDKARAAAKAIRGIVAIPKGLHEGDTDFNDLFIHTGAEDVKVCVDTVIASAKNNQDSQSKPKSNQSQSSDRDESDAPAAEVDDDRFWIVEHGVWTTNFDRGRSFPVLVCPPLHVRARVRDADGRGWGYQLEFRDPKNVEKRVILSSRELQGDGTAWRTKLADEGYDVPLKSNLRALLGEYIVSRRDVPFAKVTTKHGWQGDREAFVLPHIVIQAPASGSDSDDSEIGEPWILQSEFDEDAFATKGTLEQWREHVSIPIIGNTRPVFAISAAFAGVLLQPAEMLGGGFALTGKSSEGKTTCLNACASVWGGRGFVRTWKASASATEWLSVSRSDTVLVLDEMGQVDPKEIAPMIYQIGNAQGKSRAASHGTGLRKQASWRGLALSSGEVKPEDVVRANGGQYKAGMEVRFPVVPSNAGKGIGVFDTLPAGMEAKAFAERINEMAARYHGTAGVEFVRRLIELGAGLGGLVLKRVRELSCEFAPHGCDAEVSRVADFFALVGVAGDMATEFGITGWSQCEATNAALACFSAWLEQRGTHGSREEIEVLRQVRLTIQRYGDRFDWFGRATKADDRKPNNLDRIGFKRPVNSKGEEVLRKENGELCDGEAWVCEYLIQRESFVEHFCKGREFDFVARLLRDRGYSKTDKGKLTSKQRNIPGAGGKTVACIVIRGDQLFADSEDRSNGEASDCDEQGEATVM